MEQRRAIEQRRAVEQRHGDEQHERCISSEKKIDGGAMKSGWRLLRNRRGEAPVK